MRNELNYSQSKKIIDNSLFENKLGGMEPIEFTTSLCDAPVLPIPLEAAQRLPKSGRARVLVIVDDDAEDTAWRARAYEQFLRDDSSEDAVYDGCL